MTLPDAVRSAEPLSEPCSVAELVGMSVFMATSTVPVVNTLATADKHTDTAVLVAY